MVDTVRTEDDLLENIFQDGQPNNSVTAGDMRDFVVSSKYLNGDGWDFHLDDQYTMESPRVILGGVRTKITIDGVKQDTGHPATEHADHFWDTTLNKIIPPALNDFGLIRVAMTGHSITASTNRFELELDAGGTAGVIFRETGVFAKGAGGEQSFNFIMPLFAGPDLLANGGILYITPESDIEMWEHAITTIRLYLAMP